MANTVTLNFDRYESIQNFYKKVDEDFQKYVKERNIVELVKLQAFLKMFYGQVTDNLTKQNNIVGNIEQAIMLLGQEKVGVELKETSNETKEEQTTKTEDSNPEKQ